MLTVGAFEVHIDGQRTGAFTVELFAVAGEDFEGNAPTLQRGDERCAHGHTRKAFRRNRTSTATRAVMAESDSGE